MSDGTTGPGPASGAAATSAPPRKRGLIRSLAHLLAGERLALPVEGRLAPFDGATGWLNSAPLTPEGLRGRVVLVDFWTYTCVNWIRTLPYVRAWAAKYAGAGLTVVGVHTPEFGFERDVDNVAAAARAFGVGYPIALDNDYAVWGAFANHAWPAVYLADGDGRIRFRHLGEGEYAATEMALQQLLLDAGSDGAEQDLVLVEPRGLEVAADWGSLESPETYVGYERAERFASPGGAVPNERRVYAAPAPLQRNRWALSGAWTVGRQAAVLHEAGGRIAYAFRARDLNLVMGPPAGGAPVRFRVHLDGRPPGAAHGADVDDQGDGTVTAPRLYQLLRQPQPTADRQFEIEFLDPGAAAFAFTFG